MYQPKSKSKVLKVGLASLLVYGLKETLNLELSNEMANSFMDFMFMIIFTINAINNPNDRDKI